jgi:hypothetical protein
MTARAGSRGICDKQRKSIQRMRHTGQRLGGLVGKQAQRRRTRRQVDQSPYRRVTEPAQVNGGAHPARQLLLIER